MNKLSTGHDSTLGNYLTLCERFFGLDSGATNLIRQKIAESEIGPDEEVIAAETQMIDLLLVIHWKERDEKRLRNNQG